MNLFERKDCMLPIYALAAFSKFQQEALNWDPLVLRDAFQQQFGCKLSQRGFDKLMAGTSMIGTNLFSASVQGFLSCAAVCANRTLKQDQISYVPLKQCCWAVFVYKDMLGQTDQQQQVFSPDIVAYIQALMDVDGLTKLPSYMAFASISDQKLTKIQQAMVGDVQAFQAYSTRQLNQLNEINAYVLDMQSKLTQQLKQLSPLIHS